MMNQVEVWENDVLTIRQLIDDTAEKYGEKPCILYADQNNEVVTKTYADLKNDSYLAAYQIAGFAKGGAHIGICSKTNYLFLCYLNGIFISGNTVIPFGPESTKEQMLTLIKQADITAMIMDKTCAERLGEVEGVKIVTIPENIPDTAPVELGEDDPDKVALIMFTSGTTSAKMKGVMQTNRALISNVYFKELNNEGDFVTLSVLPMHHIFCFSCDYLKNIKDGVTIALNGDLDNIGENLLRYEPHFLRLVPMMVESLLRKVNMVKRLHPEYTDRQAAEAVYGRRIQSITAAGAKLPEHIGEEYAKLGIAVHQGYGMTETGPRIAVPNGKTDSKAAGAIISICKTRFVGGELQIQSPSVMVGYYKDEEETAKVFTEDGWFRTGDIGYITNGNHLYITGRLKNLIIRSNGENVSPEEIEKQFSDNPLVIEVMAYEEDDKIVAEFYPDTQYAAQNGIEDINAAIAALVEKANKQLASEKMVQVIKMRTEPFPRTSSGKMIRKKVEFKK